PSNRIPFPSRRKNQSQIQKIFLISFHPKQSRQLIHSNRAPAPCSEPRFPAAPCYMCDRRNTMRSEKYAANKLSVLLDAIPASDQLPESDITEPTLSASPASDPNASAANSSTGPRTIAGKKRSSLNATRHGLSGRIVVLPTEDMSLYMQHSKRLVDSLCPATPVEEELAQTVADGYWRMKRFRTVEEGMF